MVFTVSEMYGLSTTQHLSSCYIKLTYNEVDPHLEENNWSQSLVTCQGKKETHVLDKTLLYDTTVPCSTI